MRGGDGAADERLAIFGGVEDCGSSRSVEPSVRVVSAVHEFNGVG